METIVHALGIVGIEQLTELALATIMVNQFKGIDKRPGQHAVLLDA